MVYKNTVEEMIDCFQELMHLCGPLTTGIMSQEIAIQETTSQEITPPKKRCIII